MHGPDYVGLGAGLAGARGRRGDRVRLERYGRHLGRVALRDPRYDTVRVDLRYRLARPASLRRRLSRGFFVRSEKAIEAFPGEFAESSRSLASYDDPEREGE